MRLLTVTKLDPQHIQAFTECVDLMLQGQQFEPAVAVLKQAVIAHPEHAHFHYRLGVLHQQLHAPAEALACMNVAIKIQTDFAERHQQPWQQLLGPARRLHIGVNWCSDTNNKYDRLRSIPLHLIAPLLKMEVEWHSLQKEFRSEDHIMLKRFPILECHHRALSDLTDSAGLILQMDIMISVDTAVAHLAAALGKRVGYYYRNKRISAGCNKQKPVHSIPICVFSGKCPVQIEKT